MTAPCKDCPERGCGAKHDTCETYQAFIAHCEHVRQERKKDIEARNNHYDRIRRMVRQREGKRP